MKYYLDTNIIIYALKGQYPAIKQHFLNTPAPFILIPDIVLAEIEYGAQKSRNYDETISRYRAFTDIFEKAAFTTAASVCYGKLRADLDQQGTPIGANDLIIAATVLSENGILVTHNTKEFSRIQELNIEDWTVPAES